MDDGRALEIARMLRLSGREIARRRDEDAAGLGFTSTQADAMVFIRENPGCRISDLRNHLGTSHQAACTMTDRLCDRGLVESKVSERDARARTLGLTPLGIETYERFLTQGRSTHAHLLDSLSEGEVIELHSMLTRLLQGLRDGE